MKIVSFACIGIIALSLAACSKGNEEQLSKTVSPKVKFRNANKLNKPFHGEQLTSTSAPTGTHVLAALKDNHLEVSSTKTIGEVFDGYKYATKKEWRESPTKSTYFIDYICWLDVRPASYIALKEGVVKRGLDIKFAIQEDGVTYIAMVSLLDIKSDGMFYSTPIEPPEIKKIVTAIYENREITF